MEFRSSVRRTIKTVDRLWRRSTHFIRPLPDFVIVGAAKSGTTSLYNYLSQHPDILPSTVKETKYFAYNYSNGLAWYRSHFEPKWRRGLRFEGTPLYLYLSGTAERIHRVLPNAKIIILLREPVARTWSQFNHNRKTGREHRTFEEAIADDIRAWEESGRPDISIGSDRLFHYVRRSIYVDQVREYIDVFGVKNVLVIRSESMFDNPKNVLDIVCHFVGIDCVTIADTAARNTNIYAPDIPCQKELRTFFAPYNSRLFDILGVNNWWGY